MPVGAQGTYRAPRAVVPRLVAVLRPGDTSWVCPKPSRYTFYVYGPGSTSVGGNFVRKLAQLPQGAVLTASVGFGYSSGDSFLGPDTSLTGAGLNIVAGVGGTATASGGDFASLGSSTQSGGDGSVFGSSQSGAVITTGYWRGQAPGGPGNITLGTSGSTSGPGQISIVDEAP